MGGIVGFGSDQKIIYSYNTGKIVGDTSVGGIIGNLVWGIEYTRIGMIENCYNIGEVPNTETEGIGGCIGTMKAGKIINSYFLENGNMYGYTSVLNTTTPDFEQENVTLANFYNKDFLTNKLKFKEFVSENDAQENIDNVWIIDGNKNPKLWIET